MNILKCFRFKPIFFVLAFLLILSVGQTDVQAENGNDKNILYISSYHEGYKWSDDIRYTMEALFSDGPVDVNLDVYYMDTQRIPISSPEVYYEKLAETLAYRNNFRAYDLIITSDDAAFEFMEGYGTIFDRTTPHIYCGVSNPDVIQYDLMRPVGGVVEYTDYEDTLNLIGQLQPGVTDVYYIVDDSLTGALMEDQLLGVAEGFEGLYEFHSLGGKSMMTIEEQLQQLDSRSVVLYTILFHDSVNNYFSYDESAKRIAEASAVPVYAVQEFNLTHGILGGKLASGVDQGRVMAETAIQYFTDPGFEFVISSENMNIYGFDYEVLQRYDIPLSKLPEGSNIINYHNNQEENILVLHSYNQGFQWTDHIDQGIREVLEDRNDAQIYTEYMDLKLANDVLYQYSFKQMFQKKYSDKTFDLIITSDDGAFGFAKDFVQPNFGAGDIVFCGVNYMADEALKNHKGYTGVLEAYDLKGTLDAVRALQPEVSHIYVINDSTSTGLGNKKNVQEVAEYYKDDFDFSYSGDMTMKELLSEIEKLGDKTAILLMSFNRDKENNNYSYAQSIRLIYDAAKVPLYGVWDFYLDDGLLGGYLTDGHMQGHMAAEMGVKILDGATASNLPIVTSSPNHYIFDMEQMERFGLSEDMLPEGAVLINKEPTFLDTYRESREIFNVVFFLLFLTIVVIVILVFTLRYAFRMFRKTETLATFDHLTGVLNRGTGIKRFEEFMELPSNEGRQVTIAFMDLNGLKEVNDRFGHSEGDGFITTTVEVIQSVLNEEDIFCRMGGDEFMVIKIDAGKPDGDIFKGEVTRRLYQRSLDENKPYEYSVSIGMNHLTVEKSLDLNAVIEMADTLMYKEKAVHHRMRKK